ncbi:MAG: 3-isopropylmalate dehydratase small subunit [Actinobacteria bacterium]|nr:3-isopropylmalate dehydratase small subunit [Actinomycetota bacterium]
MILKGKVHKYGKNIDTDAIIAARYLNTIDPIELAKHCFEDIDADFVKRVKNGDIIAADENFGCGSSREHAPIAIKDAGISCVIAKSFARIFYRNAINIGLPILECPEAVDNIKNGDEVEIDLAKGVITNFSTNQTFSSNPFPEFMQELIDKGGLINFVKSKVKG